MPLDPGPPPEASRAAVRAWNLMGGLRWEALPVIIDMLGITDPEPLILQLIEIRNAKQEKA